MDNKCVDTDMKLLFDLLLSKSGVIHAGRSEGWQGRFRLARNSAESVPSNAISPVPYEGHSELLPQSTTLSFEKPVRRRKVAGLRGW